MTAKKWVTGIAIVCLIIVTFFCVRTALIWGRIGQSILDWQGQTQPDLDRSLPVRPTKPLTHKPVPSEKAVHKAAIPSDH